MGGYAYAAGNPITQSDSTGLIATGPSGSNCITETEYLKACGGSGTGTSPETPPGRTTRYPRQRHAPIHARLPGARQQRRIPDPN